MVNFSDSIDVSIFYALQLAKTCQEKLGVSIVPLLLGNVGLGKSTGVRLWAQAQKDDNGNPEPWEVVLVRISNETPDTLTGYDIAANTNDRNTTAAKHIRPSWYQQVLDHRKEGKKVLIFWDEITTADSWVQGASLNILMERKCHNESFKDDNGILQIAAGNYADNLSSEMSVLAPMWNRFIVCNLIPKKSDLKHFLCKYDGAALGQKLDLSLELGKALDQLTEQGRKNYSEDFVRKIGEILEQSIRIEAEVQMDEGISNMAITELKDIYSGNEDNEGMGVPNFITMRTAGWLVDLCVACYLNFGKPGLLSDNFRKVIHGTVGLALSRGKDDELKKTIVTDRYYKVIADAANDIEKMNNDKLPEYQAFFNDLVKPGDGAELKPDEMVLVTKKIQDMLKDRDLARLDRPLDPTLVKAITKNILNTLKKYRYEVAEFEEINDINKEVSVDPQRYISYVTTWNTAADLINELDSLVKDSAKKYSDSTKETMTDTLRKCKEHIYGLKLVKKAVSRSNLALAEQVPAISGIGGIA